MYHKCYRRHFYYKRFIISDAKFNFELVSYNIWFSLQTNRLGWIWKKNCDHYAHILFMLFVLFIFGCIRCCRDGTDVIGTERSEQERDGRFISRRASLPAECRVSRQCSKVPPAPHVSSLPRTDTHNSPALVSRPACCLNVLKSVRMKGNVWAVFYAARLRKRPISTVCSALSFYFVLNCLPHDRQVVWRT